ncbi:transposable element Tcb1 transposase [Trichonephila clavipes]|nr:transposable element Tcb1 transposase [Trichonephila clavipes]
MLNDDEIVTSVQQESDPVDDETDEDEESNHSIAKLGSCAKKINQSIEESNNNESSEGPLNADAFSAFETAIQWYVKQSECCPIQLLLLKRIRDLAAKKRRIIGRLKCGRTKLEVFEKLGITQSVISRFWQRFQDDASDLSRQLFSATSTTVSRQTVYRRLEHIGLYARRLVRCVPLTVTHCRLRLIWSREHALWIPQQWSCVMFSDKSRFSWQSDSHRNLIWRAPGTRYHQENNTERHLYGGAGWLVWGGIILGSRTDLHVQSVTMTGHIYQDVILEQHVRLFRGAMGAEFLFMDDNARHHRANIVDECLQSEDITRMVWPAYSPDLNPIEHVWDMLGRRIAARQPPPTCLPELRRALLDE